MKVRFKKLFNFNSLHWLKDSWGDNHIQVRGEDFPEEMKKLKSFKSVVKHDKGLFEIIFNNNVSDYEKFEGEVELNIYDDFNEVELCRIGEYYVQRKYYDFAMQLGCKGIYTRKLKDSPVIFVTEDGIENWKVLVMPYRYERR